MKKIVFLIILFTTLLASSVFAIDTPIDEYVTGDVNHDTTIDILDALLTAQYYVGMNPSEFYIENSDVDCSGDVDIVDALLISQYYVGLIAVFPCDPPPPAIYRIHISANVLTRIRYSGDYESSGSEWLPLDIGPYPEPFTVTIIGVGYESHSMMLGYILVDGQNAASGWPDATVTVSTTPDAPARNVNYIYFNSLPTPNATPAPSPPPYQ